MREKLVMLASRFGAPVAVLALVVMASGPAAASFTPTIDAVPLITGAKTELAGAMPLVLTALAALFGAFLVIRWAFNGIRRVAK